MLKVNNIVNFYNTSFHKNNIEDKTSKYPILKSLTNNKNCENNINLPGIYSKSLILNFKGNLTINKNLSIKLDNAFKNNDASEFIKYVNKHFPSLKKNPQITIEQNPENMEFPVSLIQINNKKPSLNNKISINKDGHIQITENGSKLFITKEELEERGMDTENAHIIGNGIRGFDPHNQQDWVKTNVGAEWPPSKDTRELKGVARPFVDKNNKAVLFSSPSSVGKEYGVNPKGMAVINPDSSVIITYQQTNNNPDVDFAAWSIAPFKIPKGKKAVTIFPYSSQDNILDIKSNPKWKIKDNLILLDPSQNGDMAGFVSKKANWAIFAVEGSDKAYLMRSIYDNKESVDTKFKAFCMGGKNSNYLELEFMAPRVKKGEKSTIAYKIEPIFLSNYNLENFSADKIEDESIKIAKELMNNEKQ